MRFILGLAIAFFAFSSFTSHAQDKKEFKDDPNTQPGPMHKVLTNRVGTYQTVTKMVLKEGAPAMESKGTSNIRSVLGGRFVIEETSGLMMGQPFQSIHIDGYNNATKQFESTWTYTGGTSMMSLVGTSKDGGKTIHLVGTFVKDDTGKQNLHVDYRHIDDDHFVVQLYGKASDGSKAGPVMETKYTRKK